MPTPPPIPPAERSPYGPGGAPKTFADVSHRVRHAAERLERRPEPAERPAAAPPLPLFRLAGAALAGYVLGAVIHRGAGRG